MATLIPEVYRQYLADTDPSKDYTKETLVQLQARMKRVRENYVKFFQLLYSAGIPSGGTIDQVLSKASNDSYDVKWSDLPNPVIMETGIYEIDGGSASTVYLTTQSIDGGFASNILS